MTDEQKKLVNYLLSDEYLLIRHDPNRKKKRWKLINFKNEGVMYFSEGAIKKYWDLLKKNKKRQYTFNLSLVRQESGHSYIKQQYLKNLKHKQAHGTGINKV